jgi:hypothetical protein
MSQTPITLAIESLAGSAAFRTWVAAADAAEAKAFIHDTEADSDEIIRPCAIIGPGPDFEAERVSFGPVDRYDKRGALALWLEADKALAAAIRTAAVSLATTADAVVNEMLDLSGTSGCLSIQRLTLAEPAAVYREGDAEIAVIKYLLYWR